MLTFSFLGIIIEFIFGLKLFIQEAPELAAAGPKSNMYLIRLGLAILLLAMAFFHISFIR